MNDIFYNFLNKNCIEHVFFWLKLLDIKNKKDKNYFFFVKIIIFL